MEVDGQKDGSFPRTFDVSAFGSASIFYFVGEILGYITGVVSC